MYDMSNIHYFIDMFYCFRPCVLHITTHDEKYYVMLSSVTENTYGNLYFGFQWAPILFNTENIPTCNCTYYFILKYFEEYKN